jgi:acyl-CoA synthetase (AMP-forming)/AMP-acid ligase II
VAQTGLSLADCVRPWALRTPGKLAVREGVRTLDFASLVERIDRLGNAVVGGLGIRPGSHSAIFAGNRLEYVELLLGLSDARVAPVQLAPTLGPEELAFACDDSGVRVVFVDPALEEIARTAGLGSTEIVVLGDEYERLLASASAGRLEIRRTDTDPCSIRYTSGTTGTPKASVHSHRSRAIQNLAMASEMGFASPGERALAVGSLAHGAGAIHGLATLRAGGTSVMLPIFHPEVVLRQIEQNAITSFTASPTHLKAILEVGEAAIRKTDLRSLRLISLIGAPPPQSLKEAIVATFGEGILWEEYGSTEASIVAGLRPEDQLRKPGSAGLPFYGNELRILDADGHHAEPGGASGVLHVRSPLLFSGYWNRPQETAACFRDGYFVTGDLARLDEDGYLYILARADDTMITGGLNVHPRQVEEVLLRHPAVIDAGVFSVPDPHLGEAIRAAVVLQDGATEDARSLSLYLTRHLSREKRPRSIDVIDVLPKNAAGKLDRRVLRDRYL